MKAQDFKPTQEQITAANNVFIAMAFHQTIKPQFEQLQTEVLQEGIYHYDSLYYGNEKFKRMFEELPADRIMKNQKDLCHMEGLKDLHSEIYPTTDAYRYYQELKRKAIEKGFINGENAEAIASHNVSKAESYFLDITQDIHKIEEEKRCYLHVRRQLLDIMLKLFADIAKKNQKEEDVASYFKQHINYYMPLQPIINDILNLNK